MKRFAILVSVPAILLVAACTQTPNAAPASSAPGATTGAATPPTGAATPTASAAAPPASSSSAGPGRCHSGGLSLALRGGGAAAGTQHEFLVFTNKSGGECTLDGYPGVSWVTGDQGTQVNDPFQRVDADRRTKVTLAPGGQANAVLITHTAENYPAATCKPVPVRGFRVYPPDETAAIFVPRTQTACSVRGVGAAQVDPVAA